MKVYILIFMFLLHEVFSQKMDFFTPQPTAYSYQKFAEIPVSLNTGVATVNIPITAIRQGDLNLNISLSYHSSGFTVNEQAGQVGLGWTLNVGGVITRVVRDKVDEISYGFNDGYLYSGQQIENTPKENFDIPWFGANMGYFSFPQIGIDDWVKDSQTDEYYYNINGVSGKILIKAKDSPNAIPEAFTIPYRPWKIEWVTNKNTAHLYSEDINDNYWKITTENGMIYHFGNKEYVHKSLKYADNTAFAAERYVNAWYLSHETSPSSTTNQVVYHYLSKSTAEEIFSNVSYLSFRLQLGGKEATEGSSGGFQIISRSSDNLYLSSIDIGNFKVEFEVGNNSNSPNLKSGSFPKIDFINVKYNNFLKEKYGLEYSNDPIILLDQFKKYNINNNQTETTSFNYYSIKHLGAFSKSYDLFGYLNKDFNLVNYENQNWRGFISSEIPFPYGRDQIIQPLDRKPVLQFAKAGILTDIYNPLGGHTKFEYEFNEVRDYGNVGGLRIKSVEYDNKLGTIKKQVYSYLDPNGNSSGYFFSKPFSTIISGSAFPFEHFNKDLAMPDNHLSKASYEYVQKYDYLNGKLSNKMEYQYSYSPDTFGEILKSKELFVEPIIESNGYGQFNFYYDQSFKRNLLLSEKSFDEHNNVVYQKTYNYEVSNTEYNSISLHFSQIFSKFFVYQLPSVSQSWIERWYRLSYEKTYAAKILLNSTIETIDSISTEVFFSYKNDTRLKTQQTINSDNKVLKTQVQYADDLVDPGNQLGYLTLVNKHMISIPVQEEKYTDNQLVTANKYIFHQSTGKLFKDYLLKDDVGEGGLTSLVHYKNYYQYNYNSLGLLSTITDQYGSVKTANYVTGSFLVDNVSQEGLLTSYQYNNLGMPIKVTVPDQTFSTYHFDGMNRLIQKDFNSFKTNEYYYRLNTNSDPSYAGEIKYYNNINSLNARSYNDGFGNNVQTILKLSANKFLKNSVMLDALFRVTANIKTYEKTDTDFIFDSNAFQESYNFYNQKLNLTASFPVNIRIYENHQLGRVLSNHYPRESITGKDYPEKIVYSKANSNESIFLSGSVDHDYFKVITIDRDGISNATFLDKIGRELMKINNYIENKKSSDDENVVTRFHYDNRGNVVEVNHPNSISINESGQFFYLERNQRATFYKYDLLGNLSAKETPFHYNGVAPEYDINTNPDFVYLYDKMGRIRFTVDPNSRVKNIFYYMKYDLLGRVIETGECNGLSNFTQVHAEDPTYPINSKINKSFQFNVLGQIHSMSDFGNDELLTLENYSYNSEGRIELFNKSITHKLKKIYDLSEEYLSYDRQGNLLEKVISLNNDVISHQWFEYNSRGFLENFYESKTSSKPIQAKLTNSYDENGQRITKNISTGLQVMDYSFDINDRLKSINNVENQGDDFFAMNINYDKNLPDFAKANHNSVISYTETVTGFGNEALKIIYHYDNIYRLKSSNVIGVNNLLSPNYYTSYRYDNYGRLKKLNRVGN
jgi:hypothetical protein